MSVSNVGSKYWNLGLSQAGRESASSKIEDVRTGANVALGSLYRDEQ